MKNRYLALCVLGLIYGVAAPAFAYTCPDGVYIDVACGKNCARYCSSGGTAQRMNKESPSQSQPRQRQSDRAYGAAMQAVEGLLDQAYQDDLKRQYEEAQRNAQEQAAKNAGQQKLEGYKSDFDDMTKFAMEGSDSNFSKNNENSAGQDDGKKIQEDNRNPSNPKDPSVNYNGKSCSYFTKNNDEAHINSYADGVFRLYGDRYYMCENGRWKYLRNRSTLTPAEIRSSEAINLE